MHISSCFDAPAFTAPDGSTIREILHPGACPVQNQSLAHATLQAGQTTSEHYHPKAEEIYFVLEGRGHMSLEGRTREVAPGDAVLIAPGQRHSIANAGQTPLVFLCCCAPPYSDADTILTQATANKKQGTE